MVFTTPSFPIPILSVIADSHFCPTGKTKTGNHVVGTKIYQAEIHSFSLTYADNKKTMCRTLSIIANVFVASDCWEILIDAFVNTKSKK